MSNLIDEQVLDAFAIVAKPEDVATRLVERFGGLLDRVSFYFPFSADAHRLQQSLAVLRAS
jgi:hypothetical protein